MTGMSMWEDPGAAATRVAQAARIEPLRQVAQRLQQASSDLKHGRPVAVDVGVLVASIEAVIVDLQAERGAFRVVADVARSAAVMADDLGGYANGSGVSAGQMAAQLAGLREAVLAIAPLLEPESGDAAA